MIPRQLASSDRRPPGAILRGRRAELALSAIGARDERGSQPAVRPAPPARRPTPGVLPVTPSPRGLGAMRRMSSLRPRPIFGIVSGRCLRRRTRAGDPCAGARRHACLAFGRGGLSARGHRTSCGPGPAARPGGLVARIDVAVERLTKPAQATAWPIAWRPLPRSQGRRTAGRRARGHWRISSP